MQNLNHKNIVKYLDSFKTKSHLHIILEYVNYKLKKRKDSLWFVWLPGCWPRQLFLIPCLHRIIVWWSSGMWKTDRLQVSSSQTSLELFLSPWWQSTFRRSVLFLWSGSGICAYKAPFCCKNTVAFKVSRPCLRDKEVWCFIKNE